MKKFVFPFIGVLTLITGCASKKPNTPQSFTYDNTSHIIGERKNAIEKVTFLEETDDKVNKKIIFYIDKFPYKKVFNLCNTKDFVKNITTENNLKHVKVNDNYTCKSSFYINKNDYLKAPYSIFYNLTFFNKYDYNKKEKLLLENTSRNKSKGGYYSKGENSLDSGFSFIDKRSFKKYIIIE
ncbi:MAG: hypothetical protein C0625_01615 [Arcobacter sp.]|nr:MAG: hypothetical protein C0625_01615 [Arcobacter sp.]